MGTAVLTVNGVDRDLAISPDGSHIAYISDASGEYELKVAPQDGHGEVKGYKLLGHGFYMDPEGGANPF